MKNLLSALKRQIPGYQQKLKLSKELSVWKRGLYPPGHYYSPVSSDQDLPKVLIQYDQPVAGVDLCDAGQVLLLEELKDNYRDDTFPLTKTAGFRYYYENEYFSFSDGIFLNLLMRKFKPQRIIEVGSGFSSAVMLDTNERYFSNRIELTFIEPYPEERLEKLVKSEESALIRKDFIQHVDLDFFSRLESGDFLFIDSSHVAKYGSDVNYVIFNILPILKPGVIIHFHDVFFPFEYPVEWLKQGRSWNEAYLLRAFLQYNSSFTILLFSSYVEGKYKSWFEKNMPYCLKKHETITLSDGPTLMATTGQSIYIRKN